MAEADVVVSWFASVPSGVRAKFQRPTKFVDLPVPPGRKYKEAVAELGQTPIANAIAKYAPGTTPLRVALLGFSEGVTGVANLLASGDGNRIDSVIAIDGIHAQYPLTAPPKTFFEVAKQALVNEMLFVDSYSSVKPPGYASTTETADIIWKFLDPNSDGGGPVVDPALPPLVADPRTIKSNALPGIPSKLVEYPTIPWKLQRRANGLVLLGLSNNDPNGVADHQYQAAVMLPLVLSAFLVERWNTLDPTKASA